MITIGLAGHIDHGKSALVKRLTGVDPDRLPEERERGMTIDLGFAHFSPHNSADSGTESGASDISFIDVPGHERFVRNMIAGAGGIEAALLVVAADDGWMPQSQEHFDIMCLLGLQHGLIVVTKIDLVEVDWVETIIDDIKSRVSGSFLESAPLVPVSSTTGAGYDELEKRLLELSASHSAHHDIGKPRLFADRSFVMAGMGGVVTGSMRGGPFSAGQEVIVYPSRARGKIRTLQRHDTQVERVESGARAALSFTGIQREALTRGSVITTPDLCAEVGENHFIIARVNVLPDCPVKLNSRRKLSLFLGTSETACELRPFGNSTLAPGANELAALRCESEPLCFAGDRFVLRLPTPQITIGGGTILGWRKHMPRAAEIESFESAAKMTGAGVTVESLVRLELEHVLFTARESIAKRSIFAQESISQACEKLIGEHEVKTHAGKLYLVSRADAALDLLVTLLRKKFSAEPHLAGVAPDELYHLAPPAARLSSGDFTSLLDLGVAQGVLEHAGGKYTLPGQEISVSGQIKKEAERILRELNQAPFTPPLISKLVAGGKSSREALGYLLNSGQAVKISSDLAYSKSAWQKTLEVIHQRLSEGGELNVAWLRTKLDASRKYALPILEETDRRGITTREGDLRRKGPGFESFFAEMKSQ